MAKKVEKYKVLTIDNPFGRADVVYTDIITDARREKRRWQNVGLFSLVFFLASFYVMYRAVSLQRTVPVLITLSEWGEATYKGAVNTESSRLREVPETAVQYQVRDFITKLRTIPLDGEVLYRDIARCYEMVTAACEKKMTLALREQDPFGVIGKQKRNVTIESVLKLSSSTYQVDWIETESAPGSTTSVRYRVRGVVTVELLTPSEEKRVNNPLGIYIADYDMTVLQGL
jgi:type IV secretion system protein VirB5